MPNMKAQRWQEVTDGRRTDFIHQDLDLSVARVDEEIEILGGFLYVDKSSTGDAQIALNNRNNVKLYMGPGDNITADFTRIYVTNAAQAGKTLRLVASVDGRLAPGSNISQLDRIVDPVTVNPGSSPNNQGQLQADTTAALHTIVAPAANVNGAWVRKAAAFNNGSATFTRIMAKATAPASWNDSSAMTLALAYSAPLNIMETDSPIFIPAGWGIYSQNSTSTSTIAYQAIDYELL